TRILPLRGAWVLISPRHGSWLLRLPCRCAWLLLAHFAICHLPSAIAASLLLKAAHVHTVSGATLSPGQVLVRDGRIEEVAASISALADQTIDLGAQHL